MQCFCIIILGVQLQLIIINVGCEGRYRVKAFMGLVMGLLLLNIVHIEIIQVTLI